jgi:hypothetical protein
MRLVAWGLWSFPSPSPRHDAPTLLLFDEEHYRNASIRACTLLQHLTGCHHDCDIAKESDLILRTVSWNERSVIPASRCMRSINASTLCRLMGWAGLGVERCVGKQSDAKAPQPPRFTPAKRSGPVRLSSFRRLFNLFYPVTLACLSRQQQPNAAERDSTRNSSCRRLKWERRVCKSMHIHGQAPPSPEVAGSSRYYWRLEHPTPWQETVETGFQTGGPGRIGSVTHPASSSALYERRYTSCSRDRVANLRLYLV